MDATGDGDASSAGPAGSRASDGAGAFGPNAWLVEDMYDSFRNDPTSVSESWREFFADYRPASAPVAEPPVIAAPSVSPSPAAATSPTAPRSPAPDAPPAAPPMATAPATAVTSGATTQPATAPPPAAAVPVLESAQPLRGAAGRIVANMEASLGVPTATSVRVVPAKLLEVNRTIVNNQLFRTVGGKVSFTHLIGYAVVKGLMAVPAMNAAFVADADDKGTPGVIRHRHVGLGLAVDVEKSAGQRTLLVPCIKDADAQDFRGFVAAYEELVRKIHTNKIAPDDFAGTTVTLTNPGTLGTVQSVPRLMPGQGLIVGVGALGFPPGSRPPIPGRSPTWGSARR